jgi:hypothetical protein
MLEFALLTGVRAHPGSHLYREGEKVPQLGLGSVVVTDKKHYFLCLQASCDSVRLTKSSAFLFIPLVNSSETPEVVVPVLGRGGAVHCIGLSSPATAYAESRSIRFEPNAKSRTVVAAKVTGRRGLFFFSSGDGTLYRWVADLKPGVHFARRKNWVKVWGASGSTSSSHSGRATINSFGGKAYGRGVSQGSKVAQHARSARKRHET